MCSFDLLARNCVAGNITESNMAMQILAIKQAAATKARHGAGNAALKMKQYLISLRQDYGWPRAHVPRKQRC